uniref:Uncharacterized protein n=1 Tax=Anopheles darlingi TaxID=43151 RepID=A0A2M4D2Y0_ANODA
MCVVQYFLRWIFLFFSSFLLFFSTDFALQPLPPTKQPTNQPTNQPGVLSQHNLIKLPTPLTTNYNVSRSRATIFVCLCVCVCMCVCAWYRETA